MRRTLPDDAVRHELGRGAGHHPVFRLAREVGDGRLARFFQAAGDFPSDGGSVVGSAGLHGLFHHDGDEEPLGAGTLGSRRRNASFGLANAIAQTRGRLLRGRHRGQQECGDGRNMDQTHYGALQLMPYVGMTILEI